MKRILAIILVFLLFSCGICGCYSTTEEVNISATTRPVWEFTTRITQGTDLSVKLLITEEISCLHDYSLSVKQARIAEKSDVIILSGAGLESGIDALFSSRETIDCSENISLLGCEEGHDHEDGHNHEFDPHIWLDPNNAKLMATTICEKLTLKYPQFREIFAKNLTELVSELSVLDEYAHQQLDPLVNRNLITFHDGFSYFADAYGLTILKAVEEESGSEASAAELIELINLVEQHSLSAVFTEENGSISAARVIAAETDCDIYTLDMAMSGKTYFEAMYHNIDTVKEALG